MCRPCRGWLFLGGRNPALTHWATVLRPSGPDLLTAHPSKKAKMLPVGKQWVGLGPLEGGGFPGERGGFWDTAG